ncbi:MAG: hypothetical protein WBX25_25010, partial [Rhodomicrobium sp.]
APDVRKGEARPSWQARWVLCKSASTKAEPSSSKPSFRAASAATKTAIRPNVSQATANFCGSLAMWREGSFGGPHRHPGISLRKIPNAATYAWGGVAY